MALYTQIELDQLKQSIDLAALVQSKGTKLEAHGNDKKGLCPFHQDTNPSMIITPGKNLFNCPACGTGGDVITFVQKFDNISFTQAVDFLKNGNLPKLEINKTEEKHKYKQPVDFDADDHQAILRVMNYYAKTLKQDSAAVAYLKNTVTQGIYFSLFSQQN